MGAEAESIDVELRDNEGKFVAALVENSKSLKDLGVKNGEYFLKGIFLVTFDKKRNIERKEDLIFLSEK